MFRGCLFVAAVLAVLVPLLSPADDKPAPAKADQPPGAVQDIIYFAETRPILIRLHVEVDGQAFDSPWDDYIEALFKYLDRDGDGVLNTTEAARAPSAAEMMQVLRGNLFPGANQQVVMNNDTSVLNKPDFESGDDKVTLEAFSRYYRTHGAGPVQFTLYPNQGNAADALTDVLYELLDTNKDGKLSQAELEAAEKILMKLDKDEDDLVSTKELIPNLAARYGQPAQPQQQQEEVDPDDPTGQKKKPKPPAPESRFFVVVPDGTPRYLSARMELAQKIVARYDKDNDGKLSRSEISFLGEFNQLDRNKDGFLDTTELLRFLNLNGDVELVLRIGKNDAGKPLAALYAPGGKPTRMAKRVALSPFGGVSFADRGTEIDVQGIEGVRPNVDGARQTFIDEFRALDTDRNLYVTRKQVDDPQAALLKAIFPIADRNDDGKLSEQELLTYLDLQSKAANAFIRVSLADNGHGLFGLLDGNHDGQLGVRELRTAWERLKKHDQRYDNSISRSDLPPQFRVLVSRGDPLVNGPLLGASAATAAGPLWFRLMDRNGDGDISPREFLGTEEEFRRLDLDGDGLISLDEANKAEAMRKK
jgi:Ca2+-binding EF-hand superfamily protein